jgi:hypothetical protein
MAAAPLAILPLPKNNRRLPLEMQQERLLLLNIKKGTPQINKIFTEGVVKAKLSKMAI